MALKELSPKTLTINLHLYLSLERVRLKLSIWRNTERMLQQQPARLLGLEPARLLRRNKIKSSLLNWNILFWKILKIKKNRYLEMFKAHKVGIKDCIWPWLTVWNWQKVTKEAVIFEHHIFLIYDRSIHPAAGVRVSTCREGRPGVSMLCHVWHVTAATNLLHHYTGPSH